MVASKEGRTLVFKCGKKHAEKSTETKEKKAVKTPKINQGDENGTEK